MFRCCQSCRLNCAINIDKAICFAIISKLQSCYDVASISDVELEAILRWIYKVLLKKDPKGAVFDELLCELESTIVSLRKKRKLERAHEAESRWGEA
jgi:hypothetical protein